jgi:RecA/RadA recombinase
VIGVDRIATGCKALDALTDGGLPTGTITQIFGEKALGKSILSLQAGFATVAGGNSAIILDTEQSYLSYLVPYRKGGFERRFGNGTEVKELKLERVPRRQDKRSKQPITRSELVTSLSGSLSKLGIAYTESHLSAIANILSPEFHVELDGKDPSVMILQMPDIIEMLALHGSETEKVVSEGGRVELRLRSTPTYQSALRQIIEQTHAKLLVYDSLSAPFKSTFPNTQDLPARSAGLAMLLSHAQRLCVEFGIAVVVTSHASIDPIKAWDRRPYGGITLGHEAKFSFELTKSNAKRSKEEEPAVKINPEDERAAGRAIWVQRHPALADYSRVGYANIDEEGFH